MCQTPFQAIKLKLRDIKEPSVWAQACLSFYHDPISPYWKEYSRNNSSICITECLPLSSLQILLLSFILGNSRIIKLYIWRGTQRRSLHFPKFEFSQLRCSNRCRNSCCLLRCVSIKKIFLIYLFGNLKKSHKIHTHGRYRSPRTLIIILLEIKFEPKLYLSFSL